MEGVCRDFGGHETIVVSLRVWPGKDLPLWGFGGHTQPGFLEGKKPTSKQEHPLLFLDLRGCRVPWTLVSYVEGSQVVAGPNKNAYFCMCSLLCVRSTVATARQKGVGTRLSRAAMLFPVAVSDNGCAASSR